MIVKIWWLWMIAAAFFVIVEMVTPGFFLFWFGIGAAAAGVLAWLGASTAWQWIGFIVVSGALVAVSRKFADKFTKQQPAGVGADRMMAREGIVLEEINNLKGTGLVRVEKEEWRAKNKTDEIILLGQKVKVISIEGVHLVIEKAS